MAKIVTLTPNPAIDLSTSVERVTPTLKLRCTAQRRHPGGGGVNVARVVKRFGGDVEAILPIGGFTGQLLRRLIDAEGIVSRVVEAEVETREDFYVSEMSTAGAIPLRPAGTAASPVRVERVPCGAGGQQSGAAVRGGQRQPAARGSR